MKLNEISTTEYGSYYNTYISKLGEVELLDGLKEGLADFHSFVKSIPSDKYGYRYAEGKWDLKEIIQHIIDTERVFAYRAMCISRGDQTSFPGFDENSYADHAIVEHRRMEDLIEEFDLVRKSTIALLRSLKEKELAIIGTASNTPASPRAIGFIILGHQLHHSRVFNERYL